MKIKTIAALLAILNLSACGIYGETINNYYNQCPAGDAQCLQQKTIDACTRTANRYAYSRDRLLLEEYADLMTKDASFQIEGGPSLVGREAISRALLDRGEETVVRHFSNVVHIKVTGVDTAEGISYVVVWGVDAASFGEGKNRVQEPMAIAEYHDQFKIEENTCRISSRLVKIIFEGAAK